MRTQWWAIPLGILGALVFIWLLMVVALWVVRPQDITLKEAVRLLPDLFRLIKNLAADPTLPRAIRIALVLLLAFIASPLDLIPDFIPVVGFADDVILISLVLRFVTRRAGPDAVARHWPGTPAGLSVVLRLCGLE
ncbi:MAG: YkvA family protein [Candidatus Sericytochromatia bacterium]